MLPRISWSQTTILQTAQPDAYLGPSSCPMFYDDAVKILFKALTDGKANADGIARPFLRAFRGLLPPRQLLEVER